MKPLKELITALCFCGLAIFQACNLFDEPEPKSELEKLPPLTTTGEETFGCLINGRAFVSRHSGDNRAVFQNGQLVFSNVIDDAVGLEQVSFNTGDPLEENTKYIFERTESRPWALAGYDIINDTIHCLYGFDDTINGSLLFAKIDRLKWIVSGTFEFSTVIQGCDTVHITDGRFDLKYIP